MKRTPVHPINSYIRNGWAADYYLQLVRSGKHYRLRRLMEHVLPTKIRGTLPERLHLPHPYGILTGVSTKMGEDVTLMHFTNLGPKDPWYQGDMTEQMHPILEEGVYVSMGASVLGPVTIGAWSDRRERGRYPGRAAVFDRLWDQPHSPVRSAPADQALPGVAQRTAFA